MEPLKPPCSSETLLPLMQDLSLQEICQSTTGIHDLPSDVFIEIFSHLEEPDGRSARSTCREFNAAYLGKLSSRAIEICRLLGMQSPYLGAIQGHEIELFRTIKARLKTINEILPQNVRYKGSLVDLIMDSEKLKAFWQTSYQYSLVQCFGGLVALQENMSLTESACSIQNWLNNKENIKRVIWLPLESKNVFMLPHEIGKLTNLTSLELDHNKLTSLPPEVGNLINLTSLELSSNQLASLPPGFGNLTKLTRLWLQNNQLASLPPDFGNLIHLPTLGLSSNKLTSLPPEFGNLIKLTTLWLQNNPLASLPHEIENLSATLFLDQNQLPSLAQKVGNLKICRI